MLKYAACRKAEERSKSMGYLGHLANMVVHPEPLTYLRHNS